MCTYLLLVFVALCVVVSYSLDVLVVFQVGGLIQCWIFVCLLQAGCCHVEMLE